MNEETKAGTFSIRRGIRTDLDSIVSFQLAMARETEDLDLDPEVCERGVRTVLDDESRGRYWIVEEGGRSVACLMTTEEWSDWRAGTIWWIQSVYVVPDRRRRGVYAALYRHVRAAATSDPEIRGIRLYVDRTNESAQETYRALGMNGEHYLVFEWMKE